MYFLLHSNLVFALLSAEFHLAVQGKYSRVLHFITISFSPSPTPLHFYLAISLHVATDFKLSTEVIWSILNYGAY